VWPADPHQLRAIRSTVHQWLAPLGLTEPTREDLLLAANEAASNSVEHAYPAAATGALVELTFWTEAGSICLEITDHGTWQPPAAQPDGRGFGIAMMQRLVEFVAIHYDSDGTVCSVKQLGRLPTEAERPLVLDSELEDSSRYERAGTRSPHTFCSPDQL
jgi:serine/threonine-protein kinase RsbW